jgi:hypothetical protein
MEPSIKDGVLSLSLKHDKEIGDASSAGVDKLFYSDVSELLVAFEVSNESSN